MSACLTSYKTAYYLAKEQIKIKKIKAMNFPAELKYSKEHEWVKVDGDVAVIGISDYAQKELGDIVYVEVTALGETLNQGDVFGTVEAVKTVSDLYMPVSGEIMEFNEKLNDTPELINTDPYGEGWIIKVKMQDKSELDNLLSAEDYKNMVEQ